MTLGLFIALGKCSQCLSSLLLSLHSTVFFILLIAAGLLNKCHCFYSLNDMKYASIDSRIETCNPGEEFMH